MKKMTLNNIYEWPLMTRLLLLGLVFIMSFYMGYHYDVSGQITTLAHATQQEQDIKEQLELVIHKNKMTLREISRLPMLKRQLEQWNKQLITYQNLPELLNQILKIGGDNHLFFSLFTPGQSAAEPIVPWLVEAPNGDVSKHDETPATGTPATAAATPAATTPAVAGSSPPPATDAAATTQPTEKPFSYNKVPIKVVVVGTYHQIAEFISQVANLPWIVAIRGFTITNEDLTSVLGDKMAKQAITQHLLSAELTLDIYSLPESK